MEIITLKRNDLSDKYGANDFVQALAPTVATTHGDQIVALFLLHFEGDMVRPVVVLLGAPRSPFWRFGRPRHDEYPRIKTLFLFS